MVLLYSKRFSRRAVTRPGSGLWLRSIASMRASIQALTCVMLAADGRGRPLGGIWPVRNFSRILGQTSSAGCSIFSPAVFCLAL